MTHSQNGAQKAKEQKQPELFGIYTLNAYLCIALQKRAQEDCPMV